MAKLLARLKKTPLDELYNIQQCEPDGFMIDRQIGKGAYGVIYSATCSGKSGYVVKIQEENSITEAYLTKLFSDIGMAPKLYQVWRTKGRTTKDVITIVMMEALDKTVDQYIKSHTTERSKIDKLMENTFAVIHQLHKLEFIHGDAHIDNFMMKGNVVKMIDFGFSVDMNTLLTSKVPKIKKLMEKMDQQPEHLDYLKLVWDFHNQIKKHVKSETDRMWLFKRLGSHLDYAFRSRLRQKEVRTHTTNSLDVFVPIIEGLTDYHKSTTPKLIDKLYDKYSSDSIFRQLIGINRTYTSYIDKNLEKVFKRSKSKSRKQKCKRSPLLKPCKSGSVRNSATRRCRKVKSRRV